MRSYRTKAILSPSGDQAGSASEVRLSVNCFRADPSLRMENSSESTGPP